ncbi:hypothetical protein F3Y22_tig00112230pilonHSYRG00182 [Hibiscus syriacus]|uniref:ABC transporter domain-containing protein n=1 Tax=Hibiscus syriacus TaxID=106335 RepID=A0A6A2Y804_HIBSY|nr:hypothetical protein F3Y22_tig00112230pilonHSYRG00182 [Hibiscus syriacus]
MIFAYPCRPKTLVLHQFSLEVKPSTNIGLVRNSGCGKSVVVGFIQRFYDVEIGSIKVDGVDIRKLDVQWALKEGFETECGNRGIQLSGGQKQRIVIARAIIRNPRILLLDEVNSTIDVQSKQVVQEAVDRIMVERTTIEIAHRLNTIKNVDSVAFIANGKVVEQGTYALLMNQKGPFSKLAGLQT